MTKIDFREQNTKEAEERISDFLKERKTLKCPISNFQSNCCCEECGYFGSEKEYGPVGKIGMIVFVLWCGGNILYKEEHDRDTVY